MNPILILMSSVLFTLGATAATPPAAAPVKTLANLASAWQGESNAKLRYELFAAKAESEGEKHAARLFRAAAKAEEIHAAKHAKVIKALGGTTPELVREEAAVGTTRENLEASIKGETYEQQKMYPAFIATATEEGATKAVKTFDRALQVEGDHAMLYTTALRLIGTGADSGFAVCPDCGLTIEGEAYEDCEICEEEAANFINF
jgi:rubrerythrin